MKIEDLLEKQELIPRSNMIKADKIAKEFVDLAISEFGEGNERFDATRSAMQIADNFHKILIDRIKDHAKHKAMKKIQPARKGTRVDDYA